MSESTLTDKYKWEQHAECITAIQRECLGSTAQHIPSVSCPDEIRFMEGVVQQGEAQNNDCLFAVVLLAVIIVAPSLKDASTYIRKHASRHVHTLTYPQECTRAPAETHTGQNVCSHGE